MATILKRKNKFYDGSRFGQPQIRVYHRKGTSRKSPRYLLKCGCCDEKIEIYYGVDGIEIGGVNGAVEDWRKFFFHSCRSSTERWKIRNNLVFLKNIRLERVGACSTTFMSLSCELKFALHRR